ncbi:MAG: hypothetical protein LBQ15_13110 [Clostridium sp.]|nr:hypothetical protein [Clostridium sp.]
MREKAKERIKSGQKDYNTGGTKKQQPDGKARYKIEGYIAARLTQKEIAALTGVAERTIRRETAMGKVLQRDSGLTEKRADKADFAQMVHGKRGENKGRALKTGNFKFYLKFPEFCCITYFVTLCENCFCGFCVTR